MRRPNGSHERLAHSHGDWAGPPRYICWTISKLPIGTRAFAYMSFERTDQNDNGARWPRELSPDLMSNKAWYYILALGSNKLY